MNKKEIKQMLVVSIPDMELVDSIDGDEKYWTVFIGTYMMLDPCGRYHHPLSPNGVTKRCIHFWETLEKIATDLGGWIESGEGDPCDTFFCVTQDTKKEAK